MFRSEREDCILEQDGDVDKTYIPSFGKGTLVDSLPTTAARHCLPRSFSVLNFLHGNWRFGLESLIYCIFDDRPMAVHSYV